MLEKRHYQRKKIVWPGQLVTPKRKVLRVKTEDVTPKGMKIILPEPLHENDEVLLELHAIFQGERRNIRCRCKVSYTFICLETDSHRAGLKFIQLKDEDKQFIQNAYSKAIFATY